MSELITFNNAAEILHISKSTLSRLVQRREITYMKFTKRIFFKPEWLEEYMVRCTLTAESN